MRILVLSWEYPPYIVGGIGKHVTGLVPALGGQETQFGPLMVDVVTTRYAGGEPVEQVGEWVTVHRVETRPLDPMDLYNGVISNNDFFVDYARVLAQQYHYDLIHLHDWLPGVAGITLKHEWKCPLVTTMHATERGRHQGHIPSVTSSRIDELEWKICYEAWKVIVCSRFMTGELHRYFGVPYDKMVIIPNGVDAVDLYHCTDTELDVLRQKYAPDGERLLFYVGRITHEKGLHVLIRAMPRILVEHPNTRLLVAGRNSRQMWPLARELGVEYAVHFLDFISDEQRDCLYQVVDAAVFPSLYEPFGIVALEAMAMGCNVVASDVGGLGEVVHHLGNGLQVYPNDPDSIAWAIHELFQDAHHATARRQRAKQQVQQMYGWHKIAEQTARLFEQVVEERRRTQW
jgi:glycosyltransferase involved in cell wall biosynthesis